MCLFVSMVLPPGAPASGWVGSRSRIALRPVTNAFVEARLLPGERYCSVGGVERGGCNCGTVLGSALPSGAKQGLEQKLERQRAAHLKAGWSKTKLARWEEQARAGSSGARRADDPGEAERWVALADELVREARLPYFGVLLHHYSSAVEVEEVSFTTAEIAAAAFDAALWNLEVDVLYRVRA